MSPDEFIELLKKDCDTHGVKYLFPNTPKVSYLGSEHMQVSGYFDDCHELVLACAVGKPVSEWIEIAVHESCHMDQWSDNDELWSNIRKDGIDCDKGMDDWLSGKEFSVEEYTHFVRTMQLVEIDCEKRSVKKIKDLELTINTENYIKKANSYLFFYTVMLHTKKWCEKPPYSVPEIINAMPGYFLPTEEYLNVSDDVLKLYEQNCY